MELAAAIVCDHASVREGLLIVVGGGVTRLWRPAMPAPLGVDLAILLELTAGELDRPHEVVVDLISEDGRAEGQFKGGFLVSGSAGLDPGEVAVVPFAAPLGAMAAVQSYGRYSFHVSVDGEAMKAVSFRVAPGGPPPSETAS